MATILFHIIYRIFFSAEYLKRISQNICSFSAIESYYNQNKDALNNAEEEITSHISLQDFPLGFDTGGIIIYHYINIYMHACISNFLSYHH